MAGPNDDEPMAVVDAQNMADFRAQLGHIIAVALLAEFAEATQILPDLGCGDPHLAAQRIGRDPDNTLVVQVVQIAVIAGKTVDDSVRYFLFFH